MHTITVFGVPAPQGSKRHVGNGRLVEASERLRPWLEDVKQAALAELEAASIRTYGGTGQRSLLTLHGPVSCEIHFTFNRPKSAPKTKVTYPITRSSGDLDKLCRAILDALVDAGVLRDDSQVIELMATKAYAGEGGELDIPGAVIDVREIGGLDIPGLVTVREVTIP